MMSARPALTPSALLVRGLLAGLFAGIVAFGVAYVVGEPSVNAAIAVEEAGGAAEVPATETHSHDEGAAHDDTAHDDTAGGHSHGDEAEVSRSLQSTLGLLTGTVVAGVTLGGLAGVLSAFALGRFGGLGARATTLGIAAAGFVVLYAIPYVAYPPNPPAVGSGDTIGVRTASYFALVAISIIAAVAALVGGRSLVGKVSGWYASLAAIGGYLVVTLVAIRLLPSYDEVPDGFPASVLFDFRAASFVTQFALWAVLGVVLAELVHRLLARSTAAATPPRPAVRDGVTV